MEAAIIGKLRHLLKGEINSECTVVYLLAEIRKLLEELPFNERPFYLKLFCHWALHVNLDGIKTTKKFLTMCDEYAASILLDVPTDEFHSGKSFQKENAALREFASLETFRKELRKFLADRELPIALCEDAQWRNFLNSYAGIVEDGTLALNGGPTLRKVKRVIFRRMTTLESYISPYQMAWIIELHDGTGLDIAAGEDGTQPFFSYRTTFLSRKDMLRKLPNHLQK